MRCGRGPAARKRSAGFTLFEMVVVICSIVILYMVAVQRLNQLPAAAERAGFLATLDQLKIAASLEMYTKLANHDMAGVQAMAGTNPMALMLEAPGSYRGELPVVDDDTVERRSSWYFETTTGELVYVVGGSSIDNVWVSFGNIEVNFGQVRFRLENTYREVPVPGSEGTDNGAPPVTERKWQAIQLVPVRPYRWEQVPEEELVGL